MKKYLDREGRSVIIGHNSFFIVNNGLTEWAGPFPDIRMRRSGKEVME